MLFRSFTWSTEKKVNESPNFGVKCWLFHGRGRPRVALEAGRRKVGQAEDGVGNACGNVAGAVAATHLGEVQKQATTVASFQDPVH